MLSSWPRSQVSDLASCLGRVVIAVGERVRDGFGLVVATRERDEHQKPGLALHQGGMRYDRARKNLDRHPNYILAAYMASGT